MTMLASQITSLAVVYSIVYSGVDQRKHQSSASLAFVREIHRGPVNFPQKWPVTRKIFPFDDVIMNDLKYTHPQVQDTHINLKGYFSDYIIFMNYKHEFRVYPKNYATVCVVLCHVWLKFDSN